MPKDMTSAYGVQDTSRADAQTYPSPPAIPQRRRPPETTAPRAAVLALGRAGRDVGQRDSEWSFCVRWRLVSRAAVRGSGVAAELRSCEGSGQNDGHRVILAAHPVWDDGT